MRYSSRILPILIIVAAAATFTFAGCKKKDMSLKLNEPRNIRGVVSYKRSFGDLNEKHLNVAQAIGIRVLSSREEAEKMREQLQPITTNELTHGVTGSSPVRTASQERKIRKSSDS